jgi:thiamine-phosphate pyrophosphorylase
MITSMSDILCVTNRRLCGEDFLKRIDALAACHPAGIILREKDLTAQEYQRLALQALAICQKHHTRCILHGFADAALALNAAAIHLPLEQLRQLDDRQKASFSVLGASCHSLSDALEAQRLGCTYITAGHIFDTNCKKGLPERGITFLREIVHAVKLPVYAIGGIDRQNMAQIRRAGAAGACVMSGAMQCDDVRAYLKDLEGDGKK